MTVQRQHRVNRIYVIEALRPGDLRTGTNLYETALAQRTPHNRDFSAARYEPKSKAEFLAVLAQIECDCRGGAVKPLLHIDAHGSIEGLEVSREFLPWSEMKQAVTGINVACRNHLVVVLAACEGIHLISIIRAEERAAAFAIISTAIADLGSYDVQVSFQAFYEEIFCSRDGDAALRRLNGALPDAAPRYLMVQSETMFLVGFQEYAKRGRRGAVEHVPESASAWSAQGSEVRKTDRVRDCSPRVHPTPHGDLSTTHCLQ